MRLRGVLGQVQLAHVAALRRGAAQRGLRALQTRPRHHPLPASPAEGALQPHVTAGFAQREEPREGQWPTGTAEL